MIYKTKIEIKNYDKFKFITRSKPNGYLNIQRYLGLLIDHLYLQADSSLPHCFNVSLSDKTTDNERENQARSIFCYNKKNLIRLISIQSILFNISLLLKHFV